MSPHHHSMHPASPETLEARIAPANVLVYTDVDGDQVKISSTTGDLAGKATFLYGGTSGQLTALDLSGKGFNGADIAITVTKAGGGDGRVVIPHINGGTNDFGKIVIKGRLGDIDAGSGAPGAVAIQLLQVQSLGSIGLPAQDGGGDLDSTLKGRLGSLFVSGSVKDAHVGVSRGIGSIVIGGSLIGGDAEDSGRIESNGSIGTVLIGHDMVGGAGASSGSIQSTNGQLVSAKISGSIIGGDGAGSGYVSGYTGIHELAVGRDIQGGSGNSSGLVFTNGNLDSAVVGRSLIGGTGERSAEIVSYGSLESVHFGKDIRGGDGYYSGNVFAGGPGGGIGSITISGSVVAGAGYSSAVVGARGDIGYLEIGGDLMGKTFFQGRDSGRIFTAHDLISCVISGSIIGGTENSGTVQSLGNIVSIKVGHDVVGGAYEHSGQIITGQVAKTVNYHDYIAYRGNLISCTISGSIIGGAGEHSGQVYSYGTIVNINVKHDVVGGAGNGSGTIHGGGRRFSYNGGLYASFRGNLVACTISGSVVGGAGIGSGSVYAVATAPGYYQPVQGGRVGAVHVGQNVQGGSGAYSGTVSSDGNAVKVCTIGGSLAGGAGTGSGQISSDGVTTLIKIGQDVRGGAGDGSGSIVAQELRVCKISGSLIGGNASYAGEIYAGKIGYVKVGRDVQGGNALYGGGDVRNSGSIVGDIIGRVVIGGSMRGGYDYSQGGAVIGSASIIGGKIGSVTIRGSVENPEILYGPEQEAPGVTISAAGGVTAYNSDGSDSLVLLPGPAIGKLVIKGNATGLKVLAGYDRYGTAVNGGAQVGTIHIGGDLVASDLIAGVEDGYDNGFGDEGDVVISGSVLGKSRIGHIVVGGRVLGTVAEGDQFGIEAQRIGSLKIGGQTVATDLPVALAPETGDVTVRLVGG